MKYFKLLLLVVAGMPFVAYAQLASIAGVTDANAKVPAPAYHSAFAGDQPRAELPGAPDKDWVRANRAVAGSSEAAAPAGKSGPAAAGDPHKGHHMHTTAKGH